MMFTWTESKASANRFDREPPGCDTNVFCSADSKWLRQVNIIRGHCQFTDMTVQDACHSALPVKWISLAWLVFRVQEELFDPEVCGVCVSVCVCGGGGEGGWL